MFASIAFDFYILYGLSKVVFTPACFLPFSFSLPLAYAGAPIQNMTCLFGKAYACVEGTWGKGNDGSRLFGAACRDYLHVHRVGLVCEKTDSSKFLGEQIIHTLLNLPFQGTLLVNCEIRLACALKK